MAKRERKTRKTPKRLIELAILDRRNDIHRWLSKFRGEPSEETREAYLDSLNRLLSHWVGEEGHLFFYLFELVHLGFYEEAKQYAPLVIDVYKQSLRSRLSNPKEYNPSNPLEAKHFALEGMARCVASIFLIAEEFFPEQKAAVLQELAKEIEFLEREGKKTKLIEKTAVRLEGEKSKF